MEPAVLTVLLIGAAMGAKLISTQRATDAAKHSIARRECLLLARKKLDRSVLDEEGGFASGRAGGLHVTYRLKRGGGDLGPAWTEIHVAVPCIPVALELELRPHTPEAATKVITGVPFYDTFFLKVDPAEAAPELFDNYIRTRLLALRPVQVAHTPSGLRMASGGWSDSAPRVGEMIALAVAIGSKIIDVSARLSLAGRRPPKRRRLWYR